MWTKFWEDQLRRRNKMEKSIIKTLAYSDIFDYPLKAREAVKFFIGPKTSSKKIARGLEGAFRTGLIGKNKGFYCLNGRYNLTRVRRIREKESKKKMQIASKAARILSFLPTVKLIGISGSLSMNNSQKRDDIDLFIITSSNLLWTTRFLVNLILLVFRLKRGRDASFGVNKICPNMFVSLASLEIPKNIFSAHEVAQMKVLMNKARTYEKFLYKNKWVLNFLPNAFEAVPIQQRQEGNILLKAIDRIFYRVQFLYMKKKITTERISQDAARFHPKDKTEFVKSLYVLKYKSYISLITSSVKSSKIASLASINTPGY